MSRRVQVEIRWDEERGAFAPFDPETGEPVRGFQALCYGDTPAAREGRGDDPDESGKTLDRSDPANVTEARDAVLVGWVTLRDAPA